MASFGMMNEAYFVGKNVLLDWLNNFLDIQIDKVETCANGAIYCNLFDAIHPGTIPMSRVDFTVKHEYDYTKNWKLLQNGFQKAGVTKLIPVQRLVKARYQDNLEFLQWMYKYSRDTYNGDPDEPSYDALARRSKSKGGKEYTGSKSSKRRFGAKENNRSNANSSRPISAASRNYKSLRTGHSNTGSNSQRGSISQNVNKRSTRAHNNVNEDNLRELEELRNENKRLKETVDGTQSKMSALQSEHDDLSAIAKDIERERDFYFNKVVAIEQILKQQPDQDMPVLKSIYDLLYQTEDQQQDGTQGEMPTDQPQGIDDNNNNINIDQTAQY